MTSQLKCIVKTDYLLQHVSAEFPVLYSILRLYERCLHRSCVVEEISSKESFVKDHFLQTLAAKGHANLGQSHMTLHVHNLFIEQLKLAC